MGLPIYSRSGKNQSLTYLTHLICDREIFEGRMLREINPSIFHAIYTSSYPVCIPITTINRKRKKTYIEQEMKSSSIL